MSTHGSPDHDQDFQRLCTALLRNRFPSVSVRFSESFEAEGVRLLFKTVNKIIRVLRVIIMKIQWSNYLEDKMLLCCMSIIDSMLPWHRYSCTGFSSRQQVSFKWPQMWTSLSVKQCVNWLHSLQSLNDWLQWLSQSSIAWSAIAIALKTWLSTFLEWLWSISSLHFSVPCTSMTCSKKMEVY